MSGNFTVLSPEQELRLRKLEAFYEEIRKIAIETNLFKAFPVYEALSKIDSNWHEGKSNWYSEDGQPLWGAGHGGEG